MSATGGPSGRWPRSPGLRVRIAILVILAAIAPVAIVVWTTGAQVQQEAIAVARRVVTARSVAAAADIDAIMRELSAAARASASMTDRDATNSSTETLVPALSGRFGQAIAIARYTEDGARAISPNATGSARQVPKASLSSVPATGSSWIVLPIDGSGAPAMHVFAHVGPGKGFVAVVVTTSAIVDAVRTLNEHRAETGGQALIIDADGRPVVSAAGSSSAPSEVVHWAKAAADRAGATTVDIETERHIVAAARSDQTGWDAVVSIPERDANAPAQRIRDGAIEAGVAIAIVAAMFGSVRATILTAPLTDLGHASASFAAGDASPPLPNHVGVTEVDQLIDAFADMRARISAATTDAEASHDAALIALAERSEALDEVRRTRDDIVRRERQHAIAQTVSGLAHDIHGALSTIVGYCEIVLSHNALRADDDRLSEILGRIREASLSASALLDRTRSVTSTENQADPNTPAFVVVSPNALAQRALRATYPLVSRRLDESRIETEAHLSEVPNIMGDATSLNAAMANLVANAIDAMPEGGTLSIETEADPTSKTVIIRVTDTGHGMDEATRLRCFEPFFTTKGARGTGIGLASAKATVEQHGGAVQVTSLPGVGSSFELRLPIAEAADEVPREPMK